MRKRLMGRKVCGRITKKRKKFSKGRKFSLIFIKNNETWKGLFAILTER